MSSGVSYVGRTLCRTIERLYLVTFSYERYQDIGTVPLNSINKLIELDRLDRCEESRRRHNGI